MDEIEKTQELNDDVNQLKGQVSKMMRMLPSMGNRKSTYRNPSVANVEHLATPLHLSGFSSILLQYECVNCQGVVMLPTIYPNNITQPSVTSSQEAQMPSFLPYGLLFGCAPPQAINSPDSNKSAFNLLSTTQPHAHYFGISGAPQLQHFVLTFMPQYPLNSFAKNSQFKEKLKILEDRLRIIEGACCYDIRDATEICLVPGVVIPPKFKVSDFDKYKGITCPKNHLTMYIRRITSHAHDDKLLIHFFQDSLTGVASNWYTRLKRVYIRIFKDLADAFVRQYKYNINMTSDRMHLQSMFKKDVETFVEYARKSSEIAAQVELPLSEKEMLDIFTDILHVPFYDHMIGSVSSNFSDIVMIGERVESGMKKGNIASNE